MTVVQLAAADTDSALSSLLACSSTELDALHRAALRPVSLAQIEGVTEGSYLCLDNDKRRAIEPLMRFFAVFAGGRWAGKCFVAADAGQGKGANRFALLADRVHFEALGFATSHTASEVDHDPVLRIEYPAMLGGWQIVDELREVAPGIFLGRGMVRRGAGPLRTLLWFALRTPTRGQ